MKGGGEWRGRGRVKGEEEGGEMKGGEMMVNFPWLLLNTNLLILTLFMVMYFGKGPICENK